MTVLSGGTGSAKLLRGLSQSVPARRLSVIVNVGDNFHLHGLKVCPDVDTVVYMFAGLLHNRRGWGIRNDRFTCLEMLRRYGLSAWFKVGDRDLATHLYRTLLWQQGHPLSKITLKMCRALGVEARVIPASDDWIETKVLTPKGKVHLQEFWVKGEGRARVLGVEYEGSGNSKPAPQVTASIIKGEGVLIAPANPVTSIDPILSIPGIREALQEAKGPVLAISPITGGSPFSGPAAKLMEAVGLKVSVLSIVRLYKDFLDAILISKEDAHLAPAIEELGIQCIPTDIRMRSREEEVRLAEKALGYLFSTRNR